MPGQRERLAAVFLPQMGGEVFLAVTSIVAPIYRAAVRGGRQRCAEGDSHRAAFPFVANYSDSIVGVRQAARLLLLLKGWDIWAAYRSHYCRFSWQDARRRRRSEKPGRLR